MKNNKKFYRVWNWFGDNSAQFTAVGAISAFIFALLAYCTSQQTLSLSQREFKQSKLQTEKALQLSAEALRLESQSAKIKNRPYIEISGLPKQEPFGENDTTSHVLFIFKNMGETPATNVRVFRDYTSAGNSVVINPLLRHFIAPRDTLHVKFKFPTPGALDNNQSQPISFRIIVRYKGLVEEERIESYSYRVSGLVNSQGDLEQALSINRGFKLLRETNEARRFNYDSFIRHALTNNDIRERIHQQRLDSSYGLVIVADSTIASDPFVSITVRNLPVSLMSKKFSDSVGSISHFNVSEYEFMDTAASIRIHDPNDSLLIEMTFVKRLGVWKAESVVTNKSK